MNFASVILFDNYFRNVLRHKIIPNNTRYPFHTNKSNLNIMILSILWNST